MTKKQHVQIGVLMFWIPFPHWAHTGPWLQPGAPASVQVRERDNQGDGNEVGK